MKTAIEKDPSSYRYKTRIRVRLSETDAVGIVFFGSFSSYMDVGRMDYLNHLGLTAHDGPVKDLAPGAVVSSHLSFEKPALYNDELDIHVRVQNLGRSSYTFHFLVRRPKDSATIATGALTLVWLNDTFRPIEIPKAFRDRVEEFESANTVG